MEPLYPTKNVFSCIPKIYFVCIHFEVDLACLLLMLVVVEGNADDGSTVAGKRCASMAAVDVVATVPMDIQLDKISAALHQAADNAAVATAVVDTDDYHCNVGSCANCSCRSGTCEIDQSSHFADVIVVDFRSGTVDIVADVAFHRVRHVGSHLGLVHARRHVLRVGAATVDSSATHVRCYYCWYCCCYRRFDVVVCSHRRQLHWYQ